MSKRFERLGAEVARTQDESLDDARRRARVRRRLSDTPAPPLRPPSRAWRPALGLILAAATAAAVLMLWPSAMRPITYRVDDGEPSSAVGRLIVAPDNRSVPVRFTDGASVDLMPGAQANVSELTPAGATLQLERGVATVSVRHRKATRWSVRAGPFLVRVTGTRFRVGWNPPERAFDLEVLEGEVRVSGPGTPEQAVRGGAGLRVVPQSEIGAEPPEPKLKPSPARGEQAAATERARPPQIKARASSVRPPAQALELNLPPKQPAPVEGSVAPGRPPTPRTEAPDAQVENESEDEPETSATEQPLDPWIALFERGSYELALAELSPEEIERALWHADAGDLMELGAAARHAQDRRAGYIYSVIRSRFAGTEAAAEAAFMLARMYFHSGAPQMAATWLETYLREQADGRFAREAAGRLVEAHVQADDDTRARAAAERYLERYPDGPHATLARSVLE
jgi:TolA-binding protein